jgi:hypothetical protein
MGRLCNLGFSDEIKRKLRASYAENPSGLLYDYCECGKREVAKNMGGEWFPKTHEKPTKRGPYKSGGYKRSPK